MEKQQQFVYMILKHLGLSSTIKEGQIEVGQIVNLQYLQILTKDIYGMLNVIKMIKKTILILFLGCFISCGYFENDGMSFEKEIVGNFKLQKQDNSNHVNLAIKDSPESSVILIEDCKRVFYNSKSMKIFVENRITAESSEYSEIEILNPKEVLNLKAYKKKIISKKEFDELIKQANLIKLDDTPMGHVSN